MVENSEREKAIGGVLELVLAAADRGTGLVVTDVAAKGARLRRPERGTLRTCLCESFARGTERAALASARWLGRADETAALEAATSGMLEALEQLPIDGTVVIGAAGEVSGSRPA